MSNFEYGQSGYGFGSSPAQPNLPTVAVTAVDAASGPDLTVSYTYTAPDVENLQSVRCWIVASDGRTTDNGTPYFYDSGWVADSVISGGSGIFTLINAYLEGVPTDTGAGSVDPTLHLVAIIGASPDTSPDTTGVWGSSQSTPFDIQWGVPKLTWENQPTNLVSSAQAKLSWNFSDTRGTPQGSYEITLETNDHSYVYYDSGVVASSSGGPYTIPYDLLLGNSYIIEVQAWNANGIPAPSLSTIIVSGNALPPSRPTGGPLRRFLDMLAFQLDINRTLMEQLRNANNPMTTPGVFLPALAQELGVAYEADMGMSQTRKMLSTIVHEYKEKGTFEGIEGICTAVTGWGASATVGENLITSAYAAMQPSAGTVSTWGVNPTTGNPQQTSSTYTGSSGPATWPAAVTAGVPIGTPLVAQAISSAAGFSGTVTWSTLGSGQSAPGNGIAIPPGATALSASVRAWLAGATGTLPGLNLSLSFYGPTGILLGTSTGATVTPTNSAWTTATVVNATIPAGAAWAVMNLTTAAALTLTASTGLMLVAFPHVRAASTVTTWGSTQERPREILVTLGADRVNLLANPSFESSTTTGWTATTNCTIAASNSTAYAPSSGDFTNPGTHSMQITATAAGTIVVTSSKMPIDASELYTGSGYLYADSTLSGLTGFLSLLIYDASNTLLATINGDAVALPLLQGGVAGWPRPFVQVDPTTPLPATATQAALAINITGVAVGNNVYADWMMLEEGWSLKPYFDANVFESGPHGSDYIWASGSTGPAYYYQNYANKLTRLEAVLAGRPPSALGQVSPLSETAFVPFGTTYTLLTAQPL